MTSSEIPGLFLHLGNSVIFLDFPIQWKSWS